MQAQSVPTDPTHLPEAPERLDQTAEAGPQPVAEEGLAEPVAEEGLAGQFVF